MAFDSLSGNANMTVNVASACASLVMSGTYAGTLTFTSTLTLTSTCTFVSTCTIAGTAGTLILNGASQTITSGGKTLTCALTGGASAGTVTFADDWIVNGLVTFGSTGTVTLAGVGRKVTCNGGFRQGGTTGVLAGTCKIVIAGGTWDHTSSGALNNSVDVAGNVTVSGTIIVGSTGTPTVTYLSGTVTTTGSTLQCSGAMTLATAGVTWNSVSMAGAVTYTLSSNLSWSGTLTLVSTSTAIYTGTGTMSGTGSVTVGGNATTSTVTLNNTGGLVTTGTMTLANGAVTFAGSAGFTVGTRTTATLTASRIYTLTFGNTYTVTAAISSGATATARESLKSSSAGNKVVFNLQAGAVNTLAYCDPTDVNSSGGATIYSAGATITNSDNWTGSVIAGASSGGAPTIGTSSPMIRGIP